MTYDILVTDGQLAILNEAYSRPDELAWHLADAVWMSRIEMAPEQGAQWASPHAFAYRMKRLEQHLANGRRKPPFLAPIGQTTFFNNEGGRYEQA